MAFKLRFETLEIRANPADPPIIDPITGLPYGPPPQQQTPPSSDPKGPIDPATNPNVPRATDPGDAPPSDSPRGEPSHSDFNGANVG